LRIGIDARYVYPRLFHGIGRFSERLIVALAKLDRTNEYVVFKRKDLGGRLAASENFQEVAVGGSPVSLGTWLTLSVLARKYRLDLFHSLFPVAPVFPGRPLVVSVHDLQAVSVRGFSGARNPLVELAARTFYRLAYPLAFAGAVKIVAVSEATRRDVMKRYGVPGEKIAAVHEGVDERFRRASEEAVGRIRRKYDLPERFILNVGNTRPHKNVKGLLRGYLSYLVRAENPATLVLAGVQDRFFGEVREAVGTLEIGDFVRFLGYIPEEDLVSVYSAAEAFVIVSMNEGFGLPPLEAMACGTPVAAARAGSLPEVLGDAALFVDPQDPRSIGAGILRILEDRETREGCVRKGMAQAGRYTWEKTAQAVLALYEAILGAGIKGPASV
jgi:glycosyltransferase involved in cell wall biosynthesis